MQSLQLQFFSSQHESNKIASQALEKFSVAYGNISPLQKPLDLLKTFFNQQARIKKIRDIYPIYDALTTISDIVAKARIHSLKTDWDAVLKSLHGRKVYCMGVGESYLNTALAKAVAQRSLAALQQTIKVGPYNLNNPYNRDRVIDYIYRSGQSIFNFCYCRGFVEALIKSKDVRCIVARDEKDAIVGILWGYFISHEKQSLFHFWELSRLPTMPKMGIAKRLIDCAKEQQVLYPKVKFATLNVDFDNHHAKEIYLNEQFAALDKKEKNALKVFMSQKVAADPRDALNPATAKQITKKFVMATIPIYKLVYYEIIRQCQLAFRTYRYR